MFHGHPLLMFVLTLCPGWMWGRWPGSSPHPPPPRPWGQLFLLQDLAWGDPLPLTDSWVQYWCSADVWIPVCDPSSSDPVLCQLIGWWTVVDWSTAYLHSQTVSCNCVLYKCTVLYSTQYHCTVHADRSGFQGRLGIIVKKGEETVENIIFLQHPYTPYFSPMSDPSYVSEQIHYHGRKKQALFLLQKKH